MRSAWKKCLNLKHSAYGEQPAPRSKLIRIIQSQDFFCRLIGRLFYFFFMYLFSSSPNFVSGNSIKLHADDDLFVNAFNNVVLQFGRRDRKKQTCKKKIFLAPKTQLKVNSAKCLCWNVSVMRHRERKITNQCANSVFGFRFHFRFKNKKSIWHDSENQARTIKFTAIIHIPLDSMRAIEYHTLSNECIQLNWHLREEKKTRHAKFDISAENGKKESQLTHNENVWSMWIMLHLNRSTHTEQIRSGHVDRNVFCISFQKMFAWERQKKRESTTTPFARCEFMWWYYLGITSIGFGIKHLYLQYFYLSFQKKMKTKQK